MRALNTCWTGLLSVSLSACLPMPSPTISRADLAIPQGPKCEVTIVRSESVSDYAFGNLSTHYVSLDKDYDLERPSTTVWYRLIRMTANGPYQTIRSCGLDQRGNR